MVVPNEVVRVPCGHDRDPRSLGETKNVVSAIGETNARAKQQHRTLGRLEFFDNGICKRRVVAYSLIAVVRLRIIMPQAVCIDECRLHIERNIKPDGPWTSVDREMIGLLQMVGDVRRIKHNRGVLRHRAHARHDVVLLVAKLPERDFRRVNRRLALDLPGHHEHRDRIKPPTQHSGNRVGAAGPARDADRRKTPRHPRVAFRRDGGSLLMVVIDARQPFMVSQGVVEVHGASACHGEDVRNPLSREVIGYEL